MTQPETFDDGCPTVFSDDGCTPEHNPAFNPQCAQTPAGGHAPDAALVPGVDESVRSDPSRPQALEGNDECDCGTGGLLAEGGHEHWCATFGPAEAAPR